MDATNEARSWLESRHLKLKISNSQLASGLFVEFFVPNVVGATSSEGWVILPSWNCLTAGRQCRLQPSAQHLWEMTSQSTSVSQSRAHAATVSTPSGGGDDDDDDVTDDVTGGQSFAGVAKTSSRKRQLVRHVSLITCVQAQIRA